MVQISTYVRGSKFEVPLLFLPGSLCDKRLFSAQIEYFTGLREVYVGDFGGCASIHEMALKMLAEAPPKFALAGLSMGGIVAFEMYRRAPQRIDRLALLDTNPRAELAERVGIRQQQTQHIADGGDAALAAFTRAELLPTYATSGAHSARLEALVLAMANAAGSAEFVNQWRALEHRPDSWPTLRQIACPTLILCGEQDALCSADLHREMAAEISSGQLEIVADAGHLSTLDAPQHVNRALHRWLE
ncbi:MAG: alpha/beta hydrolase [Porticoccaceae bacterium]|nr:alpha/beta hydrolase [Porticoccaceae bacterium]